MNNKHSEKYIRIGLNIALQRKLKKMTQNQLAEKIGINKNACVRFRQAKGALL